MRQLLSPSMMEPSGRLVFTDPEACRYLFRVLRIKRGERIDVRFPDGTLCVMSVQDINTKTGECIMQRLADGTAGTMETGVRSGEIQTSGPQFWLFQFLPKLHKADMIIRQAAETGISYIVLIAGERSPAGTQAAAGKTERWNRIIREARQQSGSPVPTRIISAAGISEAMNIWLQERGAQFCSVMLAERSDGSKPLHACVSGPLENAAAAVGCEGGMSENERQELIRCGFIPVHFQTNILRTETAALYGVAALQTIIMENSVWRLNGYIY